MIDLKILTIKDLLTITAVRYASIVPRSLIIEGLDFTQANSVMINNLPAPEFMIISDHQLIAQVPFSEVNNILSKVAVLSDQPSVNHSSLLSFSLGSTFKSITGLERLIQIFIKLLLQTPGSDRFDPTIGGGLLAAIGNNYSGDSSKAIQSAAVTAVNRTRDQLITIQSGNTRMSNDEKLLTATVDAVGFDATTSTLQMHTLITAVSGSQAVANLSL